MVTSKWRDSSPVRRALFALVPAWIDLPVDGGASIRLGGVRDRVLEVGRGELAGIANLHQRLRV